MRGAIGRALGVGEGAALGTAEGVSVAVLLGTAVVGEAVAGTSTSRMR